VIIVTIPKKCMKRRGIKAAMARLGGAVLRHNPINWIFRDITEITIPNFGVGQWWLERLYRRWPQFTKRLVMWITAQTNSGISAVYSDVDSVKRLTRELSGDWLAKNRRKSHPISVVLSGLPDDVNQCCQAAGLTAHTYLHSLDVFGQVEKLPEEDELALLTMCGHGLIASRRIQHLVQRIRKGKLTARQAAEDIAKPCVCGIVSQDRAEEIFARVAARETPVAQETTDARS
jgi:hypothetical protein